MTTTPVMVNGEPRAVADIEPYVTALDWLRDQGLTGAKEGCAEGECGACSIMVARPDGEGRTLWTALNACLVPVLSLDGQEVVTAEGLGKPGALHPVQEEMAHRGGSQCGYCTPGFICSMAAEYYRPDRTPVDPSSNGKHAADHEHGPNGFDLHALSGNLCRCTGYRPIRDAAYALDVPPGDDTFAKRCATPAPAAPATRVRVGDTEFARPADLAAAVAMLAERPDATVIAGCTDWGVEVNLRGTRAAFVVAIDRLPELRTFSVGPSEVELGAALTLSEAERLLDGTDPAARSAVAAVRLPADPQRRDAGRQPRHRLSHRGRTTRAAGTRGDARAVRAGRRSGGRAGRLLHRLPADREAQRRTDPGGANPAAARPVGRLPQDRQAAVRRHLKRCNRIRVGRASMVSSSERPSASAGWRQRRCGPPPPKTRCAAARGPPTPCGRPPRCSVARAPRSTTTGPVLPSVRRCSSSRCSNSMPNPLCQRGPHHE